MKPETEAFIHAARELEDVSQQDERRVKRSLDAALAAGATASVAVGVPATLGKAALGNSWFSTLGAACTSTAGKLGAVVAVGALGYALHSARTPDAPTATELAPIQVSRGAPTPRRLAPPEAIPPKAPELVVPELAPSSARRPAPPTRARSARSQPPSKVRPQARGLREELELVQQVQAALKHGDGELALKQLEAHETSDRQLAVERRALRILALCAAGKVQVAHREARAFLREYPASVHHEAIRNACANR